MKTITTNLYKFSELSKEVQEKLLEKNRYYETQLDDWHDPITEGFTEDMAEAGFAEIETQFSGFYSQGDGACFMGRVTDLRLFMENFENLPQEVRDFDGAMEIAIIKKATTFASRYCHSNTIKAYIEVYDIQGRLIAQQKAVNATTASIYNLKATNQVLIIKVIDENNNMVIKKTIN